MTDDPFTRTGEQLYEQLTDDDIHIGPSDSTDVECWREDFLKSAFEEASRMVTQHSMDVDDSGGMHNSPVPAEDNVADIHVYTWMWDIPQVVIEVDDYPEWADRTITETRIVYARQTPGRAQEKSFARIQVRPRY